MEDRVAGLEQAVADLQQENARLREELVELRALITVGEPGRPRSTRTFRARWSVLVLAVALVAVPAFAYSTLHNGLVSTLIGALNGLILFIVGPGAWRLLIEGVFRAIPAVLFGQATRIAWEQYRNKRKNSR